MMSAGVLAWWCFLCAAAVLNIVAWSLSAVALRRRQASLAADTYRLRRLQWILSGVYVFGCAFRSAFPVYDVPRLGLVDHWLSSVMIGRSVATVAELCFVGQLALMVYEISRAARSTMGRAGSLAVVPMIVIAESCSWYSVLTTSNLGHVAEESLWGLSVALLVVGMAAIYPRCVPGRRPMLLAWCFAGIAYVAFMFAVDVPMYWSRWVADEAAGRHYLSIAQGLLDVSVHRTVSYRWQDWKHEVAWMSLYFSVAVWISISLIHAPAPAVRFAAGRRIRPIPARIPT